MVPRILLLILNIFSTAGSLLYTEAYFGSCQTSTIGRFAKVVPDTPLLCIASRYFSYKTLFTYSILPNKLLIEVALFYAFLGSKSFNNY